MVSQFQLIWSTISAVYGCDNLLLLFSSCPPDFFCIPFTCTTTNQQPNILSFNQSLSCLNFADILLQPTVLLYCVIESFLKRLVFRDLLAQLQRYVVETRNKGCNDENKFHSFPLRNMNNLVAFAKTNAVHNRCCCCNIA